MGKTATPLRVVRAFRILGRFVDQTNDLDELLAAMRLLEAYATRVQRAREHADKNRIGLTLRLWRNGEHFIRELPSRYRWRPAREER